MDQHTTAGLMLMGGGVGENQASCAPDPNVTWASTWTYPNYTYYNTPRFAILIVGRDLVKLDTATGETWQKDWYDKNWRYITNG